MVFWEQRLVILATPKTGSTALESALGPRASMLALRPPELKHTPAYRYRRFVGPWLEKAADSRFEVVAVMREPQEWLGSWYRFRRRETLPLPRNSTAGMSFENFVEGYIAKPRTAKEAPADNAPQREDASAASANGVEEVEADASTWPS